jgi:hypothetical protein
VKRTIAGARVPSVPFAHSRELLDSSFAQFGEVLGCGNDVIREG